MALVGRWLQYWSSPTCCSSDDCHGDRPPQVLIHSQQSCRAALASTSLGPVPINLLLVLLLLTACSHQATRWEYETYTVRAGDTLYAIAWHFDLDHRDLARWNGLGSGDVIHPGQRLRLRAPVRAGQSPAASPASSSPGTSRPAKPKPSGGRQQAPLVWQWPTRGRVLAAFGDPASVGKGIDIGGQQGAPVVAAADGRVVYAGSGLVGYGKLIIIKHNDTYLSAYGHNDSLLAGQGDVVTRGQRIARMGIGPRRSAMLHFEIRVNGEAVDPIRFLPRR